MVRLLRHHHAWAAAAVLAALAGLWPTLHAQAPRRLAIAAASDLQAVLPDIVRDFERSAGATVAVSYGSSGTFFAQIRNGAPFDVFLSADVDYPRQLTAAKLADAATLQVYARGHLVLWTRRESRIEIGRGLNALTDARIRYIAVANPAYAPYGRAAVTALRSARLYDTLQPKLVMGENLAQAAQLVESGNADAGILSLSLALGPALRGQGSYVEIPTKHHPPIDQGAVVVSASREPALARRFIVHLRSPQTAMRLERFGFTVPAAR
jgi:molybdate transport system substrate-binding protein